MARMTPQPSRRYRGSVKTLSSLSRVNLLRELQTRGPQTIAQLAAATGLHQNTAREHLQLLIRAGYVRSEAIHRPAKGRPQLRYRAANKPPPGDAARRDRERDEEPQHRDSSATLNRQLEALNSHLNVCGFAATLEPGAEHMTIRDCPYSELARDNSQVCEMHHRLLRNALDTVDGPLDAPTLHPFSGANECTVDFERDDEKLA